MTSGRLLSVGSILHALTEDARVHTLTVVLHRPSSNARFPKATDELRSMDIPLEGKAYVELKTVTFTFVVLGPHFPLQDPELPASRHDLVASVRRQLPRLSSRSTVRVDAEVAVI